MSRESFPQAGSQEGMTSQPGIDPALAANGFAPELPPVPGAESTAGATAGAGGETTIPPLAEAIAGAVTEGVVRGLQQHTEAQQARQAKEQADALEAARKEAEAKAAREEQEKAERLARIRAMPALQLDPIPPPPPRTHETVVKGSNSPMTVVDGVVVAGHGVIGTAADARRLREPHAKDGVTPSAEALAIVRDSGDVAFKGVGGFIRKRRAGANIAKALEHRREADVATEAAASVVHARKPAPGLEADTRRQERLVRGAVDTVEDQQFANAMVRRNTYLLRAAAKQNGIKGTVDRETGQQIDINNMTAEQLIAALRHPGTRLTGNSRKVLRVAERRLGAAQEHAEHAAHELHEVAEGHTIDARVHAKLGDKAMGRARKAVDKQAAKERGKAAKSTKVRSLGGPEGQRLR